MFKRHVGFNKKARTFLSKRTCLFLMPCQPSVDEALQDTVLRLEKLADWWEYGPENLKILHGEAHPGLSGALFLLLRLCKHSMDYFRSFAMTEKSGNGARIKVPKILSLK